MQPVKNQSKLVRYIKEIADALEYIHSKGIIHCDLKLSNIFAYRDETQESPVIHLKIADFGLSLIIDDSTNKAYMKLKAGTFSY